MKIKRLNLDWKNVIQKLEKNHPLTTFETARICGVTHSTITQWIKHGKLNAYQTPGKHRRIYKDQLLKFLNLYQINIPTDLLQLLNETNHLSLAKHPEHISRSYPSNKQLLFIGCDTETTQMFADYAKEWDPKFEISEAKDFYEVGKQVGINPPKIIIIHIHGINDPTEIFQKIRADKGCKKTKIYILCKKLSLIEPMIKYSCDGVLTFPIDLNMLKKYFLS